MGSFERASGWRKKGLACPRRVIMTIHYPLDRRTFLVAGGLGFFGLNLAHGDSSAGELAVRKLARSTVMIWLSGGASHIDTWDMKPDAPAEYRGPFNPIATTAPGVTLCE